MRKSIAIAFVVYFVLMLLTPIPNSVAEIVSSDDNIRAGEQRSIASVLAGRFVSMAGNVPDFLGMGQTVSITGEVEDNAVAFGEVVQLEEGVVHGDLLALGKTVIIDGEVQGDVYAGCEELKIGPHGGIYGNLYLGADRLSLEGFVVGELHASVRQFFLDGELGGGEIHFSDEGGLDLGPGARIDGDLRYWAEDEAEIPPMVSVSGSIDYAGHDSEKSEDEGFNLLKFLWSLVASMVVGLVLLAVSGSWMRASAASVSDSTGPAFAWGALFLIATPLALVLVMITLVGIPLGILGAALYAAALYLAALPLSLWMGDWLLRKMGRKAPGAFLALSLGLLLYKIMAHIPWLGILVVVVTLILGLGAMFLGCRRVQAKLNP